MAWLRYRIDVIIELFEVFPSHDLTEWPCFSAVTSLMFLSIISGNGMHHLLHNIKKLRIFHTHCKQWIFSWTVFLTDTDCVLCEVRTEILLFEGGLCTLDAGLLARSQYPEGPATGHLDTGFSWSPWDGSQVSKLLLHASHVALPT